MLERIDSSTPRRALIDSVSESLAHRLLARADEAGTLMLVGGTTFPELNEEQGINGAVDPDAQHGPMYLKQPTGYAATLPVSYVAEPDPKHGPMYPKQPTGYAATLPVSYVILVNLVILVVGCLCFTIYRRVRRDQLQTGRASLTQIWSRSADQPKMTYSGLADASRFSQPSSGNTAPGSVDNFSCRSFTPRGSELMPMIPSVLNSRNAQPRTISEEGPGVELDEPSPQQARNSEGYTRLNESTTPPLAASIKLNEKDVVLEGRPEGPAGLPHPLTQLVTEEIRRSQAMEIENDSVIHEDQNEDDGSGLYGAAIKPPAAGDLYFATDSVRYEDASGLRRFLPKWLYKVLYDSDDVVGGNRTVRNYLRFLKACSFLFAVLSLIMFTYTTFLFPQDKELGVFIQTLLTVLVVTVAVGYKYWVLEEPFRLSKDLAQASHTLVARWDPKTTQQWLRYGEQLMNENSVVPTLQDETYKFSTVIGEETHQNQSLPAADLKSNGILRFESHMSGNSLFRSIKSHYRMTTQQKPSNVSHSGVLTASGSGPDFMHMPSVDEQCAEEAFPGEKGKQLLMASSGTEPKSGADDLLASAPPSHRLPTLSFGPAVSSTSSPRSPKHNGEPSQQQQQQPKLTPSPRVAPSVSGASSVRDLPSEQEAPGSGGNITPLLFALFHSMQSYGEVLVVHCMPELLADYLFTESDLVARGLSSCCKEQVMVRHADLSEEEMREVVVNQHSIITVVPKSHAAQRHIGPSWEPASAQEHWVDGELFCDRLQVGDVLVSTEKYLNNGGLLQRLASVESDLNGDWSGARNGAAGAQKEKSSPNAETTSQHDDGREREPSVTSAVSEDRRSEYGFWSPSSAEAAAVDGGAPATDKSAGATDGNAVAPAAINPSAESPRGKETLTSTTKQALQLPLLPSLEREHGERDFGAADTGSGSLGGRTPRRSPQAADRMPQKSPGKFVSGSGRSSRKSSGISSRAPMARYRISFIHSNQFQTSYARIRADICAARCRSLPVAFVSFFDPAGATRALEKQHEARRRVCSPSWNLFRKCRSLVCKDHVSGGDTLVQPPPLWLARAPPPGAISWENLAITQSQCRMRLVFSNICLVIGFYFIAGPTVLTAIGSWIATTTKSIIADRNVHAFAIQQVPFLLLYFVNSFLVPRCISYCSIHARSWRKDARERIKLNMNYLFLVVLLFWLPLLQETNSWEFLRRIILAVKDGCWDWNFTRIGNDVGSMHLHLHLSSRFAIQYILSATSIGSVAELFQLSQFFYLKMLNRRVLSFDLGYWFAYHLSTCTLALTFSISNWLLFPIAAAYFWIRYVVDKYIMYTNVKSIEFQSDLYTEISVLRIFLFQVTIYEGVMCFYFHERKVNNYVYVLMLLATLNTLAIFIAPHLLHLLPSRNKAFDVATIPNPGKFWRLCSMAYRAPVVSQASCITHFAGGFVDRKCPWYLSAIAPLMMRKYRTSDAPSSARYAI